jgi:prepilin-type N-terminal cleavage/methylation domain-containing protein
MFKRHSKMRPNEQGMTMVELIIAMAVLAIGLGGVMVLVGGAISSNGRNKFDTTATTLSEMVLERIASAGVGATGSLIITDCANTDLTVNTAGSDAGSGATLSGGNISFSGAAPTGYGITYVTCAAGNAQPKYDIRWNIITHSSNGSVFSKTITVSARQKSAGSLPTLFATPVTLRTVVTN